MSLWIQAVKTSITSIIDNVKKDHANAAINVGFVAYRDFCDGTNRLQVRPLTPYIEQVLAFIALTESGGGDGPEDIPGGLQEVLAMGMQAEAKCVVLIADAPRHGSEFRSPSSGMIDGAYYIPHIGASPSICEQMRTFDSDGVDFAFIEVVPTVTAKMVSILKEEYCSVLPEDGQHVTLCRCRCRTLATWFDSRQSCARWQADH